MVHRHVCGCYYLVPSSAYDPTKCYLPQVQLKAHTTIYSTTSRTNLTQTFINPSKEKGIKQLRYTFPLYDGVSVVGFTCHIGARVVTGVVKERDRARQDYTEAVDRGEVAGLFEQLPEASDLFTTTIGNVPPGAEVVVEITYLGELKHDAETDGIRFTIPTSIAPRYGSYPGELAGGSAVHPESGINVTIDASMPDGTFIREVRSPSHQIAVSMGTISTAPDADPGMNKASTTLSLGSAHLDKDFVLQIAVKDIGTPKALLETHPTIKNQRALLATLVPKFSLPSEKPEIVFICDRSGSMAGEKISAVVSALKLFLKSLPVGVKFNIVSFGSRTSFLWPKSQTYSKSTLDEAVAHVETFQANFGGTEMLAPIQAAIDKRYKDIPFNALVLTDGQIRAQRQLFDYINSEVVQSKNPIRLFSLGVGQDVSHSLIEGIARAGNGFAQAVMTNEKLDSKVVRMLKGALSPHINDYTLEVKYSNEEKNTEDEEFELVEKVADCLTLSLDVTEKTPEKETKPISLFDESVDLDKPEPQVEDKDGQAKYSHLPAVEIPKLLQTPSKIPPLFPFNRTSVYILMSPETIQRKPTSVVLRASSAHGPLHLEIPIQNLEQPGETIHQLAAKKAITELEEGRGWINEAKTCSGQLLKEAFESRFDDMVEREAVRLGVQYQVGGKWCSFVAVEKNDQGKQNDDSLGEFEFVDEVREVQTTLQKATVSARRKKMLPAFPDGVFQGYGFASSGALGGLLPSSARGLSLSSAERFSMSAERCSSPANKPKIGNRGSDSRKYVPVEQSFGMRSALQSLSAAPSPPGNHPQPAGFFAPAMRQRRAPEPSSTPRDTPKDKGAESPLQALVSLLTFEGFWELSEDLTKVVGVDKAQLTGFEGVQERVLATALAIAFLEKKLGSDKDAWELMAEKARDWLEDQVAGGSDELLQKAAALII